MTYTNNDQLGKLCDDYFISNIACVNKARHSLAKAGLVENAFVRATRSDGKPSLYRVTGIRFNRGSISVYGNKKLANGLLGRHEHYIGRPNDVHVLTTEEFLK